MSLVYCAIVPHPPVIVPEVGEDDIFAASVTVTAMKKIGKHFNASDIDSVIVISPHTKLASFAMTISNSESYSGGFSDFNCENVIICLPSDIQIINCLIRESKKVNFPINIDYSGELDHGASVPLYWIKKNTNYVFSLVEIGYSSLSFEKHFDFGQIIASVIKKSKKRIALIISGDLSHRLFDSRYSLYGKEFDQKIKEILLFQTH